MHALRAPCAPRLAYSTEGKYLNSKMWKSPAGKLHLGLPQPCTAISSGKRSVWWQETQPPNPARLYSCQKKPPYHFSAVFTEILYCNFNSWGRRPSLSAGLPEFVLPASAWAALGFSPCSRWFHQLCDCFEIAMGVCNSPRLFRAP